MPYEFRLPDVGEGIAEAEIVRWLVNEGETVKLDQPLVEIETDKAVVEVPSPVAGVVLSHGGEPGAVLKVGDILAVLDAPSRTSAAGESARPRTNAPVTAESEPSASRTSHPLATPAVRKLARDLGVDLSRVSGTGLDGRVTAEDLQSVAQPGGLESIPPAAKPSTVGADEERIPLRGLRRRIAESMTQSWRTIPHITGMEEVDATNLVELRDRLRLSGPAEGLHLGYLPFIVKSVVSALKLYPAVNSWLDEQANEIVYRHKYNIGIATATEEGLIVPVLHDADQRSVRELQEQIATLTEQARSRTIALADLQGGTFTITNFGSLGGWLATPIIRPGEAAILGVGRIQDRPWVVDGRLEVRPVLPLSFSADHRLIDGDVSTAFMSAVVRHLGDPLSLFLELA